LLMMTKASSSVFCSCELQIPPRDGHRPFSMVSEGTGGNLISDVIDLLFKEFGLYIPGAGMMCPPDLHSWGDFLVKDHILPRICPDVRVHLGPRLGQASLEELYERYFGAQRQEGFLRQKQKAMDDLRRNARMNRQKRVCCRLS